jgi:hypothetical protein
VVYLDPKIPSQWRPWVEQGVKAWLPVFESIGFRSAIVITTGAYTPGTALNHLRDTAVSLLWNDRPSADESPATDTPTTDPQTGEILGVNITIPANIFEWTCFNYLAFTYGADPQAKMPCADSINGRILTALVTHEVGHSLGFAHNFKAGSAYPTDSLRNAAFVRHWGHTASVMSYAPINWVAQTEDHIPFANLVERLGPYDTFALGWAYRPIPSAKTPEDELPTLEQWRSAQDTAPYLRASIPGFARRDPGDKEFVRGNDMTKSAEYGLRNLARIGKRLDVAPNVDEGQKAFFVDTWRSIVSHVVDVIGGATPRGPYSSNPKEIIFEPIDSAHQVQAFHFLLARAFHGQDELVHIILRGQIPADTSAIVLFDSTAPGWKGTPWRQMQEEFWTALLSKYRLTSLVKQAPTTHVLQVICPELRGMSQALATAATTARSAAARTHVENMRQQLEPVLAEHGACHL